MSKPDWKDAPEWAGVLVRQKYFDGWLYCWAEEYKHHACARWVTDREISKFILDIDCWALVESRP